MIVEGYLKGMPFDCENDCVVWLDALPNTWLAFATYFMSMYVLFLGATVLYFFPEANILQICWFLSLARYAEFSKAVVDMALEPRQAGLPEVIYYGIFREDPESKPGAPAIHKKVQGEIEAKVFQHWDALSTSPAKTRPKPQTNRCVEGLSLLSSTDQGPVWPGSLDSKFNAESAEGKELLALKQAFLAEFPPSEAARGQGNRTTPAQVRATGQPDFSVEGGQEPLDVSRLVDLLVEAAPPPADRQGASFLLGDLWLSTDES